MSKVFDSALTHKISYISLKMVNVFFQGKSAFDYLKKKLNIP